MALCLIFCSGALGFDHRATARLPVHCGIESARTVQFPNNVVNFLHPEVAFLDSSGEGFGVENALLDDAPGVFNRRQVRAGRWQLHNFESQAAKLLFRLRRVEGLLAVHYEGGDATAFEKTHLLTPGFDGVLDQMDPAVFRQTDGIEVLLFATVGVTIFGILQDCFWFHVFGGERLDPHLLGLGACVEADGTPNLNKI